MKQPRPRVAPYLTVSPAAAAIAFYTGAFDAKQRALMPSVDGLRIAHCELLINGGSVMLADVFPEFGQVVAVRRGQTDAGNHDSLRIGPVGIGLAAAWSNHWTIREATGTG